MVEAEAEGIKDAPARKHVYQPHTSGHRDDAAPAIGRDGDASMMTSYVRVHCTVVMSNCL